MEINSFSVVFGRQLLQSQLNDCNERYLCEKFEQCHLFDTKKIFCNEDKTLWLVGYGVIYNHSELYHQLRARGHEFCSDNPIECILHLYEEYGRDASKYLHGSFVYVIYDKTENQIFASRDRIGEICLYYAVIDGGIVLSSNIRDIVHNFISDPEINMAQISDAAVFSFPTGHDTVIESVWKVPPASNLCFSESGFQIETFWKKENIPAFTGSKEDAKKYILQTLRESVDRAIGDREDAVILLSGGIDSSAIAAIARESHKNVHVLTVGYNGIFKCDERNVAERFANEKNLIWHSFELSREDFENTFDEYIAYMDEPVGDLAAFGIWNVYKKAKELGFKRVICGNGSDEIFYGYSTENQFCNRMDVLFNSDTFKKKLRLFQLDNMINLFKFFLHTRQLNVFFDVESYISRNAACFFNEWKLMRAKNSKLPPFRNIKLKNYNVDGYYNWLQENWLINNCTYLSSKFGQVLDCESCSPFLDQKLQEAVLSLPFDYKYDPVNSKAFLKEILRGIVPDYILNATKRGFTMPKDFVMHIMKKYKVGSYNELIINEVCKNLADVSLFAVGEK